MRIIAGKYKGRKLLEPKDYAIRPTADKVREALFDILQGRIVGAAVLDLFAGTGAVGLEALSRGAASLTACDASRDSVSIVRANMQKVGEAPTVLQGRWQDCLCRLQGQRFDFIYLDPPYDMDILPVLAALADYGLCATEGLVVYEHDATAIMPDDIPRWLATAHRRYGRAVLSFLQPNTSEDNL